MSSNYSMMISVLLILASQRIEDIMGWDLPSDTTKRGSLPSVVEYCILAYVAGQVQYQASLQGGMNKPFQLQSGANTCSICAYNGDNKEITD